MVAHLVWDQRAAGSNPVIPTKKYGSLAQLGERLPYKQDVTGSSPVTPTKYAGVAQLVEQLICNQQVAGSSPITSSTNRDKHLSLIYGRVPEWPKGADCKSVATSFDGSNPSSPTTSRRAFWFAVFYAKNGITLSVNGLQVRSLPTFCGLLIIFISSFREQI